MVSVSLLGHMGEFVWDHFVYIISLCFFGAGQQYIFFIAFNRIKRTIMNSKAVYCVVLF